MSIIVAFVAIAAAVEGATIAVLWQALQAASADVDRLEANKYKASRVLTPTEANEIAWYLDWLCDLMRERAGDSGPFLLGTDDEITKLGNYRDLLRQHAR